MIRGESNFDDKYVKKVFNWSEVHLSEMTCYKIHTQRFPEIIYIYYLNINFSQHSYLVVIKNWSPPQFNILTLALVLQMQRLLHNALWNVVWGKGWGKFHSKINSKKVTDLIIKKPLQNHFVLTIYICHTSRIYRH